MTALVFLGVFTALMVGMYALAITLAFIKAVLPKWLHNLITLGMWLYVAWIITKAVMK